MAAAAAGAGSRGVAPSPGTGAVQQGLKEALFEALGSILSPVQEVRAAGEEQIKVLEVTEEFGVHLAELTVDPQGVLAIRQLASVILKQYVENHWCNQSEKFHPPETTERAKLAIRELLPNGLREPISKVRSSVAYAISAIAHWDWPEAWPELFRLLMEMLISGDVNAVHGAMRVLTEFTREVTDTQMPLVAPVILPEMYKIFTMAEVYSIRTRARAVEIFTTCANLICAIEEVEKGAAKALIFPVVQQFTEAFVQALQMPDGPRSDSGLKMDVLKAVTALVKNFPKHMVSSMQQILPIVWSTLTESAAVYVRTEVNYMEEVDDPVDSDGEVLGFENLVFNIFEFVHTLLENRKFKSTVKKALPELIYYIILYMQITEEQIKVWTGNPHQFVEDEDDDTFSYSVRISAQDLLLAVASDFQSESAIALAAAATKHLQEAEQAKSDGNVHWWKIHEACMLALGSVKNVITESLKNGRIQFDMHGFLTNVVLVDLNLSDPVVASLAQDIFKELAQIEACQGPMQMRLIPTLVSIMHAPSDKIPSGLCATAIDILTTVVRNTKLPLSEVLICQAFPVVAQCTLHTDDNATMQNGGECLRAYVAVALEQIAQWHDDQGHNGLWYVMQVVSQLLDPRTSEYTAAFVGRLVSTLISKAGSQLGENLDQILRAILSKMQQAETLSVMQSLIMVFAQLVHNQLEPLLEFLCSLPGPTGKPALEFVMSEWTSRQPLFYGQYEGKVSTVAMCKLLQHGINTDDKRLRDIMVKGEEIFNADEGIRTRSKAAKNPERWTNIPLLVKLFKLLIGELSSAMEANLSRQSTAAEWNQDEVNDMWEDQDDDDDEDDDEGLAGQLLSDLLNPGAGVRYDDDYYDEDDEDDPDTLKDPLYQVDLQAYLTDYLRQFAQQPCYTPFSDHLNEKEKRVLRSIGI
ncbi:importin-9 isoform X3 [Scyliorhinus torazame]|uniref:importin-9 isoform X3 n=1 Tax=Scyliorhinus torazame TaxID=75743 RepID=UPI003B5CA90B